MLYTLLLYTPVHLFIEWLNDTLADGAATKFDFCNYVTSLHFNSRIYSYVLYPLEAETLAAHGSA